MRKLLIITILLATQVLWGCSQTKVPFVHRIDIQQGNVVTQEMLGKLEPGQDKQKVRYIMGTPLLVDVFHQEEWIYLYSFQTSGEEPVRRRVSLFFDDERLSRIEGDIRPAGDEAETTPVSHSRTVDVPTDRGDEDGGFLRGIVDRFKSLKDFSFTSSDTAEAQAQPAQAAPENEAAAETMPPETPTAVEDQAESAEQESMLQRVMRRLSFSRDEVAEGAGAQPADADTAPEPAAAPDEASANDEPQEQEEGFFSRLKRRLNFGSDAAPAGDQAEPPSEP